MRLACPHCGERDQREFTPRGAHLPDRPDGDWGPEWHDWLHLRDNPAGRSRELWYHGPCGAWLVVDRDTVTHAIHGTRLAREAGA